MMDDTAQAGSCGYTCIRCGQWVPNMAYHACTASTISPIFWTPTALVDAETKQLLRRIAEALEKLAAK